MVLRKVWLGRRCWAWRIGVIGSAVGGCWMLVRLIIRLADGKAQPLDWLTGVVLSVVFLWCAWILGRSSDVAEFMLRQSRRGGEGG